jgi:hypothetical protein
MQVSKILATAMLLLSVSAAFGQNVKVDVDATVNFSNFRTFGFAAGPVSRNPLIGQIIVAAVESELIARGLTRKDESPDLKVVVAAAAGMDLQAVGPTWNNVNYRTWGGYQNPAAMMNITTGTLLIDLVTTDRKSVFRGVAKETLNRGTSADPVADAKSVDKLVKQAVRKMFKKYPAAKRST